ncbi:hypothetical protein [Mycobacterium sp. NPDC050853]|uniref:hypothetical protein n=1 Tax=Mycobacterium sp. NPDC050853 TaxID=3155160 RepID=UPI0033DFE258
MSGPTSLSSLGRWEDSRLARERALWSSPAAAGTTGEDSTRQVQVRIGKKREPLQLMLREAWRRQVPPAELADAVMAAYSDAVSKQQEDALREPGGRPLEDDDAGFDEAKLAPYVAGSPRSSENYLGDIASAIERCWAAERELAEQGPTAPPALRGPLGSKVRLRLSEDSWLAGIEIDPEWAGARTAAQIMNEFSRVLHYLREENRLAVSEKPAGPKADREAALADLDALILEGVAALRSMP